MNRSHIPCRVALGACLLALAGCNRGPEYGEVEGTVTLDGKPLNSVEVVFLPDPDKGNRGPRAAAYTDERGHYQLFCEKADRAGAVAGAHRVCVFDLTALSQTPGKAKPSRLPPVYGDAQATPFRDVTVRPGTQTLDFNVEGGKKKS